MANNPCPVPSLSPTLSLPLEHHYAQLPQSCFEFVDPTPVKAPAWIAFNASLASELGLDADALQTEAGLQLFAGNQLPPEANPLSMAYSGHQFGHFNPQLGDGRAILLGEVRDPQGRLREIQLKGAGPTPFSRRGDGRSALGPALREYLVSEAMFALGVPTTRALAVVSSGEKVWRDPIQPGAVFTRVARSHLRIGTLEHFAARRNLEASRALLLHALQVHGLQDQAQESPSSALLLFETVISAQASLVAHWLSLGFIHGVMNTDNMSLSGETIDYGPCAFMDSYRADKHFSSIDRKGRYAYANQPRIAHWNLARLAEALLPFIIEETQLPEAQAIEKGQQSLAQFQPQFQEHYQARFAQKLGFPQATQESSKLAQEFLALLEDQAADFTLAFHSLSKTLQQTPEPKQEKQTQQTEKEEKAAKAKFLSLFPRQEAAQNWLETWQETLQADSLPPAKTQPIMQAANPVLIPRNHQIEAAIRAGTEGDFSHFHHLNRAWQQPFEEQQLYQDLQNPPRPEEEVRETFCGT